MIQTECADVLDWAAGYKGAKFHSILCDPPYHLTSITDRFGKKNSAKAQYGKDGAFQRASRGFMGSTWDGGDVSFRPETWAAIREHTHPGAFGFAYASARGWHRMAIAIEDAGFVHHPTVWVWCVASGFPKATRVKDSDVFDGHRYGAQALKPAAEPVICFQNPYDGRPLDNITMTGAGALNIDAGRISGDVPERRNTMGIASMNRANFESGYRPNDYYADNEPFDWSPSESGRWPANFAVVHHHECVQIGVNKHEGVINRFTDGAKPFGGGAGHDYESETTTVLEEVWSCHESCPARLLNEQSGASFSPSHTVRYGKHKTQPGAGGTMADGWDGEKVVQGYGDSGGASRYFFQAHWSYEVAEALYESDVVRYEAKASRKERDAGLNKHDKRFSATMGDGIGGREHKPNAWVKNPHPTVKPIALNEWLARLLLPPEEYAPRRILVPFAGVGSEMIGAWRAGFDDIIGVELNGEYVDIAEARIDWWVNKQGVQLSLL